MGWVSLIDVSYNPLRFRFRLHGTNLRGKNQGDLTGKYLEEHPIAAARDLMTASWREVIDRRAPTHGFYEQTVDGQLTSFEALRLPLSSDGQVINMLLVSTVPKA
jgi:hypothetical protein